MNGLESNGYQSHIFLYNIRCIYNTGKREFPCRLLWKGLSEDVVGLFDGSK